MKSSLLLEIRFTELKINDDPLKALVVGVGSSFHSIEILYTTDGTTGEIIVFYAMPTARATFNKPEKGGNNHV